MFLRVIACCVGIVLAVWIAVKYFDLDLIKYHYRYSSQGLVISGIGLALVAWIVYSLIKGIKTGVWKGSKLENSDSAPIYKREDDPQMFWFCVVINATIALGILFGIFYWVFIGAG